MVVFIIDAAFLIKHRIAVETRRYKLILRWIGQHVARYLINGEILDR